MDFNTYQNSAAQTAIYPPKYTVIYPAIGLADETGEVLGKIKKVMRDGDGDFWEPERLTALSKEIGDVLWYVAVLADDLGLELDDIARLNIEKLADRKERGVLGGSGDER